MWSCRRWAGASWRSTWRARGQTCVCSSCPATRTVPSCATACWRPAPPSSPSPSRPTRSRPRCAKCWMRPRPAAAAQAPRPGGPPPSSARRTPRPPAADMTPIRVLIAKVGLDGHDRGAKVVARALRDAGMDVIYTGLHRTPEEVVAAAVQEDVDVLGISILSGAHMTLFPRVRDLMRTAGAEDIILVGGGVIPDEDVAALKGLGVAEVILQDTPPDTIVERLRQLVAERTPRYPGRSRRPPGGPPAPPPPIVPP